ncbi:NAD(P)/FAD-dependent oxidoreductase [Micromonospora sp. 4G55]|uniref:flavin-containing monooxygenase n=1 Tax=Micromonospora sp. 4G55 TaxID=2806102 RepID=UPI001A4F4975|nr:NAD(P)/FAD-dependent oxidoreductase [Micromonospora sp. 4G55]MBM0256024.1 NAD(P)/FAD-dependent oxidoreductase [Micromonospora sp. 4G55]
MTPAAVVIGAGPAGLAAGAALLRRHINPVILEQGAAVGTSWRHRHQELHLNTIRWLSHLPGLRIPRRAGRWVSRDDYIDYLERFTRHERLQVHYGVRAHRIDPVAGGWQVTTDHGRYRSQHVVVATGHDRVPNMPDWSGRATFQRPIRHVADLRRVADLAGARVLLVGAGNSGVEIAGHLVDAGVKHLWMSVRTPPTILPRQLYGVPLHPLTLALRPVPERIRDRLARAVAHHAFGDLSAYGLPTPRRGPFERMRTTGVTVAIDQGFIAHLTAGRVHVVAEVDHLDGPDVVLDDGTRLQPDLVLAATGYVPGLTGLVGHLGVLDHNGRPKPGAGTYPLAAGLWFIGYQTAIEGNLRQHPIEARRIARAIGLRARKPINS